MENIYVYFAAFRRAACNAGWPKDRIDEVIAYAMSSDYSYALEKLLDAISEIQEEKEPIAY